MYEKLVRNRTFSSENLSQFEGSVTTRRRQHSRGWSSSHDTTTVHVASRDKCIGGNGFFLAFFWNRGRFGGLLVFRSCNYFRLLLFCLSRSRSDLFLHFHFSDICLWLSLWIRNDWLRCRFWMCNTEGKRSRSSRWSQHPRRRSPFLM